jgi:hypothetical protein
MRIITITTMFPDRRMLLLSLYPHNCSNHSLEPWHIKDSRAMETLQSGTASNQVKKHQHPQMEHHRHLLV